MGCYYENYNENTEHELSRKFDEELEKLARLDGRDISTELEWLVGREILRRELEQYSIDREIKNLQHELEESSQRGSIQLSINDEMRIVRELINIKLLKLHKNI